MYRRTMVDDTRKRQSILWIINININILNLTENISFLYDSMAPKKKSQIIRVLQFIVLSVVYT